ncbi:MAG: hypothetical protein AAGN46_05780 [Acidobacteriota bacterium]
MSLAGPHFIHVGDERVALPEGVTLAEWSRERTYWQNPRIRAFLGCIRMLGGVMESNYAILHCSPERLIEIWRKVREVSELMLTQVTPLLDNPSCCPELEDARATAESSLTLLADTVLADLERFPTHDVPADQRIEVRKLLCVSIGKIHAFLQDTFGRLMAADPRSRFDADYFLSRRFPQDVEEAEWLHATVEKLRTYLAGLDAAREEVLTPVARRLRDEQTLPSPGEWRPVASILHRLLDELTPRLREVLALRGIRFHEMEILDRYAVEIPNACRLLDELFEVGRHAADEVKNLAGVERLAREQVIQDLVTMHAVFAGRASDLLHQIDTALRDLRAFVPLWLEGIERRRALLLKRTMREAPPPRPDLEEEPLPGTPWAANLNL